MNNLTITEVKPNEEAQSSLITFEKDDILIGAMRVYFHRVVLSPIDGITRSTCFVLSPIDFDYLAYSLLLCDLDSTIDYAQGTSKGSTMPYAVWEGGLGEMKVLLPPKEKAKSFNEIVLPMLRRIQKTYFENKSLAELRDALLPKLMAGEINLESLDL